MMMRRLLVSILIVILVAPFASAASAFSFDPNYVISDAELLDSDAMNLDRIQAFLDANGTLGTRSFPDIDGVTRSAAEIIYGAAQRNGVNPRVILVMLQKEQSLVGDTDPTASQLDWAMGYGICDYCNYQTESAQRFRGFAKQINSATLQLVEGYMADVAATGQTVMGFGPGIETEIDGTFVVFANAATAALYTYTPHTHGNQSFATLWQSWFSLEYPDGTLLQNDEDGGVWLVRNGVRRPITSRAALLTRYNEDTIVPVSPTSLESYPVGTAISLPNYSLLRSPRGTVYLLVDDTLRGIASQEAFRSIGFNPDEIVDVTFEELSAYAEGEPITTDTVYPQGTLLQDASTGGVYFVENGTKAPIMSREILASKFPGAAIVPVKSGELDLYPTVRPVAFQDGTLVSVAGKPDVFVISEGMRRPIQNEETFLSYGWKWTQVVVTDNRSVEIQPLGEPIAVSTSFATESDADVQIL
jgi:hypothetical protein